MADNLKALNIASKVISYLLTSCSLLCRMFWILWQVN